MLKERDFGQEIDVLRETVAELKSLLASKAQMPSVDNDNARKGEEAKAFKRPHSLRRMHPSEAVGPDPRLNSLLDSLIAQADESDDTGRVSYAGVFESGGYQSSWSSGSVSADGLLALIEEGKAEKVLACIGSNSRLNLLLSLLRKPRSVAELVAQGGYNSPGQVYHHLRPLITADIVKENSEDGRGVYAVRPYRVQGVIMLLAGIADLLDDRYSQGEWE